MTNKYTLSITLFLFCFLSSSSQIQFNDEASARNLSGLTQYDGNGLGVSFVDYDGDGWDDITLPTGNGEPLRFFKNTNGFFVEQQLISPAITSRTRSVSWVDYDNDGDKDLFVVSDSDGSRLYRQEANSSFTNVTLAAGLFQDVVNTFSVSWGDIDNDGCLDLFFSNRTTQAAFPNFLFKNNCDGTFSNITQSAGISSVSNLSFGAAFFDYNNDGFQDIYVINDKTGPNVLYENNDGNGTFSDVSAATATDIVVDAMSVTIDDYNNDGFFDIYITNTPNSVATPTLGSVLLKNNNGVAFEDVSLTTGTQLDGWCWGANFLDAENDSDLDLYVSCDDIEDETRQSYGFYQNENNGTFTRPNNVGFLVNDFFSSGSATGDVDNDGKADIIVINNDLTLPNLWMNRSNTTNNYLAVNLVGTSSNRDAVGSKIEISLNGNKQYRYIINGESYISQNSFKKIFGLGTNTIVDYVKVYWLSGIVDTLFNVNANAVITITEGSTLSLTEYDNSNLFTYYPNPVKNTLTLNAQQTIDTLVMYNMLGQEVMRLSPNTTNPEVDMSSLNTGAYFVNVSIGDATKTVRILKQ